VISIGHATPINETLNPNPPPRVSHRHVHDAIELLDRQGKLHWKEVKGGKVTYFTHEEAVRALQKRDSSLEPRLFMGVADQWNSDGEWFESASIFGDIPGWLDCGDDSDDTDYWMDKILLREWSVDVCTEILNLGEEDMPIKDGWRVYTKSGVDSPALFF
jgi:hypothetical protein